jgi:hypothetical protein
MIRLQFHDDMEEEIDEKSIEQSNKAPMPVPSPSDTLNSGLRHDTATAVAERRGSGHVNTFGQSREGGSWTVEGGSRGGKEEE